MVANDASDGPSSHEMERLQQEIALRRRRRRAGMFAVYALLIATVVVSFFFSDEVAGYLLWAAILGTGIGLGTGKLQAVLQSLGAIQDKRLLGPLVDLLDSGAPEVEGEAKSHLKALLPSVNKGDRLLTPHQSGRLGQLLLETTDGDFALKIATAIRRMEDTSAIPALERLVGGKAAVEGSQRDRLTTFAQMTLADLRMAKAREIIAAEDADQMRLGSNS